MKIILAIFCVIVSIIAVWFIGKSVSYRWQFEDNDRALDECIETLTRERQNAYVKSWKFCPAYEVEEESITTDESIMEWIESPIDSPVEESKKEPKENCITIIEGKCCIDLVGFGNNTECITK